MLWKSKSPDKSDFIGVKNERWRILDWYCLQSGSEIEEKNF